MPQVIAKLPSPAARKPTAAPQRTILLVEDEEMVRNLVGAALRRQGYRVLACGDANAGIEAGGRPGLEIDLLLTDLTIPGMSGAEMAQRIQRLQPQLRVVFMSGEPQRGLSDAGQPHTFAFLQKPFTLDALTQILNQALARPPLKAS